MERVQRSRRKMLVFMIGVLRVFMEGGIMSANLRICFEISKIKMFFLTSECGDMSIRSMKVQEDDVFGIE